jgi:alanyl-tRNA synthetase
MMTSAQIRQSFLDFFREKQHTIVPSSSLLPDSPNLLFTNAGMNQFVPIFLGEKKADVSKWGGAVPGSDTRAADTQKCIRAGGKHNDLDDVGLDTYHHTFFEMLGNWSFGDYFKKEAIDWAWELIVERWKFPAHRVYATIYQPDKSLGDPAERDEEAWNFWAEKFRAAGLDPAVHIVNGNKKDNFWMMGETGPCGPCSELHIDLTPAGDTRGALVNKGTAECIEIWNLVFIQFNANPDGTFTPLPAQHVDTGMGFERVTSIIQGTKEFTDFANAKISNYETDIFRPIFDELEKMSGKRYSGTLPSGGSGTGVPAVGGQGPSAVPADASGRDAHSPSPTHRQDACATDIAFRVIADHIRTLSFAIADGIQPGNNDRNYVLRRILRRAVRYGRTLGFKEPFFYKLVGVLARTMGDVFPEIRAKQKRVEEVLKQEEEAFNRTLDRGIELFEREAARLLGTNFGESTAATSPVISGAFAFRLYDEQGFPLDLTELMARERGLSVDRAAFDELMERQRKLSQAAQKKTVIELSEIATKEPTRFLGYDALSTSAKVLEVVALKDKTAVILDASAAYAEMGGQVGDSGELTSGGQLWRIVNTTKTGHTWLHFLEGADAPAVGCEGTLGVDATRRHAIERHHTATHLLHWALHEVVSREATQKGSSVAPDKLTFDFNSAALTPQQVRDVERLVNERIVENAAVSWCEVPYADVRGRAEIMQFFGDKYGETVRVVQIGGAARALDGYSMELCAGTHTRATGEIGLFRIASEAAIAAGVRRIEAVAGLESFAGAVEDNERLKQIAAKLGAPLAELEKKLDAFLAHQKELERALKSAQQREAAGRAKELLTQVETIKGIPAIIAHAGDWDGDALQTLADSLKASGFKGVTLLGGVANGAVALVASVSPDFTAKVQAGKLIQAIAPMVGGKGGGRPDNARGGGKEPIKLAEALTHAKTLL